MNGSQNCPICDTRGSIIFGEPANRVDCPRCGQYEQGRPWSNVSDIRHRLVLSGWVREQNAVASVPVVAQAVIERTMAIRLPQYRERAARALAVIARKHPGALMSPIAYGQAVQDLELQACSYSASADDLRELFKILESDRLIEDKQNIGFLLTPKGLLAAEDMAATGNASAQGFVAMSFDETFNDAWTNGFDLAIRSAGFRPFRIDAKDYVGGITDEIMAEIRRSRFVVADYTGQVNGVYFEVGFALGRGLAVIPTCRQDQIASLHFDIKHLNTLVWGAPQDLAVSLRRRIEAVIGKGPDVAE